MATTVLGLKTFTASDPVDYNEINDNYNKIDNGVKTAMQGRAAHNLLDNSNFRNPVNQRGFSSTTSTGESMGIDRWLFSVNSGGSLSLTADGLVCQNANLIQKIESKLLDSSKEYTQVFWLSDGTPVFPTKWIEFNYSSGVGRVVYYGITGTIAAAAIYEGSYTADTLPAYQPKGYAAELAECKRYFQATDNPFFVGSASTGVNYHGVSFFTPMRIVPTITVSSQNGFGVVVVSGTRNGFIARNDTSNTAQIIWNASADL